jgi:hypothetical protein
VRLLTRLLLVAVTLAGLAACGEDRASSPLELMAGGACGDAYFWATTDSGDVAVTVAIEARDRPRDAPTTRDFVVPDATVKVEVLQGENLGRNFCTDLPDAASEPQSRRGAVAGEGTITLGPAPEGADSFSCGTVAGELELTGLEADDGTTFAPIRVTSDSIGCYAG